MVVPIDAGLTSKPGKIILEDVGIEVPAITLEELISRFGIDESAVMKMDCEGCEYDIILNDYEHVRMFEELIFEYHEYITKIPAKMLFKVLSKDFICKLIEPERKGIGLVKCVRKG